MANHDILDDVFQKVLQGSNLFSDRDVLRHDYIPKKLPHREQQILCLGEITAPVLRESRCSNVFIYGKTGTGKTAVVKSVLNRLVQKAKQLGSTVKACYVNCRLVGTEYRILSSLCTALGLNVPFTGLAVSEVFDRFKKSLDTNKIFLIVILDEIDALIRSRGDVLLYELTRVNETLNSSRLSIVGISNDLNFKEFLDPRVLSSLSEEEMVFRPYNANELSDILSDRAQIAFKKGSVHEGTIDLCAALAAAEHGDARRALDLLRVAGEVAERKGDTIVTLEHIREAEKRIEHNRTTEALKNLPLHSKIVLCSIYLLSKARVNYAITGDIYEIYSELCEISTILPLTQRRVSSLINELDIIGLLNTRVVSMGRYGRTRKTRLSVARALLKDTFLSDNRLCYLVNYTPKCLPKTK